MLNRFLSNQSVSSVKLDTINYLTLESPYTEFCSHSLLSSHPQSSSSEWNYYYLLIVADLISFCSIFIVIVSLIINWPFNWIKSSSPLPAAYHIHSQSEEEILSPGEEADTIDTHPHQPNIQPQHYHQQEQPLLSTAHHHHHHPHSHHHHHHHHQQQQHQHHHHHPDIALIPCPGTTIILPPRPPDRPRILSETRSNSLSQSTGLICDHLHENNNDNNNNNNNSESDIRGLGRGQEGNSEGRLINLQIGEDNRLVNNEEEDNNNPLPPEIPPLPPSPLHHQLFHHHHHIHHQLYQNNFSGFPSLEALEEHHRQHHNQNQYQQQEQHQISHRHYPFLHHFHLPLQRSSTIESPSGGSDFQLPCSPESEDSDMTSVIKGPSYKARAPKNSKSISQSNKSQSN